MIGGLVDAGVGFLLGELGVDEEWRKRLMIATKIAGAALDAATGDEATSTLQLVSAGMDVASSGADAAGGAGAASFLGAASAVTGVAAGQPDQVVRAAVGGAAGAGAGLVAHDGDLQSGLAYATMGAKLSTGSLEAIAGRAGGAGVGAVAGYAVGKDERTARVGAQSGLALGGGVSGLACEGQLSANAEQARKGVEEATQEGGQAAKEKLQEAKQALQEAKQNMRAAVTESASLGVGLGAAALPTGEAPGAAREQARWRNFQLGSAIGGSGATVGHGVADTHSWLETKAKEQLEGRSAGAADPSKGTASAPAQPRPDGPPARSEAPTGGPGEAKSDSDEGSGPQLEATIAEEALKLAAAARAHAKEVEAARLRRSDAPGSQEGARQLESQTEGLALVSRARLGLSRWERGLISDLA